MKDGMVVAVDHPEVREAQEGIMEFLLINHPLDCPICDQAGECGLQDYSFKHGQAFSRFRYEEKRTYPGRERIPLGPSVVLNMNRCIQCTRCIRFTEEISGTGELGFFQRGARTEIGVFPGKVLDNDLSTCVVDVCPVGALTSSRFRFAERVWYLDKKPSICTGCDVGCNVTVEHRRGAIKRLKPRLNEWVNDYWMCDHGRATHERWQRGGRAATPKMRRGNGSSGLAPTTWAAAVGRIVRALADGGPERRAAFVASGQVTTEEAFLLARTARAAGAAPAWVCVRSGPTRTIPTPHGATRGSDAEPNRRGAALAGLEVVESSELARRLELGDEGRAPAVLLLLDPDFAESDDPSFVAALRRAELLVVATWQDGPLAAAADVVLPLATAAEKDGTLVNVQHRLQRLQAAFPPPGEARPGIGLLADLLAGLDPDWRARGIDEVFARMAAEVPRLAGLSWASLPAEGVALADGGAPADGAGGG
jgi:NADH-quinone oxidoreductase subunit G